MKIDVFFPDKGAYEGGFIIKVTGGKTGREETYSQKTLPDDPNMVKYNQGPEDFLYACGGTFPDVKKYRAILEREVVRRRKNESFFYRILIKSRLADILRFSRN